MTPQGHPDASPAVAEVASPEERAARIAEVAQQTSVRAVAIHAEDVGEPDPSAAVVAREELELVVGIDVTKAPGSPAIRYDATFECEVPPSATRAGMRVEIVLRMGVNVPADLAADDDALVAYGEKQVVEALFPFFRETFQSLSLRMGRLAALTTLGAPVPWTGS